MLKIIDKKMESCVVSSQDMDYYDRIAIESEFNTFKFNDNANLIFMSDGNSHEIIFTSSSFVDITNATPSEVSCTINYCLYILGFAKKEIYCSYSANQIFLDINVLLNFKILCGSILSSLMLTCDKKLLDKNIHSYISQSNTRIRLDSKRSIGSICNVCNEEIKERSLLTTTFIGCLC